MRIKRIVGIILSLAAVFSLALIRDSVAWINTQSGTPLAQSITAKKLNFEFSGTLGSYLMDGSGDEYILPGQNLIVDNGGHITALNTSTIVTALRFKVIYDAPGQGNSSIVCSDSNIKTGTIATDEANPCAVLISPGSNFSYGNDGFFYYNSIPAVTGSSGTSITLLNSIEYNEGATSVDLYNPKVNGTRTPFEGNVQVIVQAKQQNHVNWDGITWTTS